MKYTVTESDEFLAQGRAQTVLCFNIRSPTGKVNIIHASTTQTLCTGPRSISMYIYFKIKFHEPYSGIGVRAV
jgi:hypothetical protein